MTTPKKTLKTLTRVEYENSLVTSLGGRLRAYFPEEIVVLEDYPAIWVDRLFENICKAIEVGDYVAIDIACKLIDQDPMLPFGKIIKSNLARALRRKITSITQSERTQIIDATFRLLALQYAHREVEDYVKLVGKFPFSEYSQRLELLSVKNQKTGSLKVKLFG